VTSNPRPAASAATGVPCRNASLIRRYASLGYEGLLLAAIAIVTGFVTIPLVSPVTRATHTLEVPTLSARAFSACVVFGVAGIYFVWSWTEGRRTLPMKTWGLALTRAGGGSVDTKAAVLRYLAAWIGPLAALAAYQALAPAHLAMHAAWLALLNYAWPIVDRDRQFLHDRIAGTRIVAEPRDSGKPR
jgi:uncharacterized RDD family membrane protein YckC